jgi:hypothetical protein
VSSLFVCTTVLPQVCSAVRGGSLQITARMDAIPFGGYSGPGACPHPPVYAPAVAGSVLRWEGRIRCGKKLHHIGRFLTREVRLFCASTFLQPVWTVFWGTGSSCRVEEVHGTVERGCGHACCDARCCVFSTATPGSYGA